MESHNVNNSLNIDMDKDPKKAFDYSKRAQWLRAAVLGANDGLVSTALLMMGVNAVKQDANVMILSNGLVAGLCSMVIGGAIEKEKPPSPTQAAIACASAFSFGAIVPLLAAAFVKEYKMKIGTIVAMVTLVLVLFGWLGAVLGKAPLVKSSVRVLIGGCVAMAVTFGLTKLIGSDGH